jgi:hypothetical protein
MSEPNLRTIEGTKSDADKAKEYKAELRTRLEEVCAILNRANADGLVLGFNITRDGFGRNVIGALDATKPL